MTAYSKEGEKNESKHFYTLPLGKRPTLLSIQGEGNLLEDCLLLVQLEPGIAQVGS